VRFGVPSLDVEVCSVNHGHIDDTYTPTYNINMKPVQILIDEELLAGLDEDEEVRRVGRSKVLRGLIAAYLESRREARLDLQYRQGYGESLQVSEELDGGDEEGSWPEE
jgi:hypothetical protein